MLAYVARRLGVLFVILFGSSFILYNLAAISGDPLQELRTSTEPNAKQQIINLTRELKLDVPPPLRYFIWLKGILGVFRGQIDFGKTREAEPVLNAIAAAVPITIRLVTAATFIAIILGISLGIVTALRQYSRFDYSMTFVAFLMFSLPIFWVAVLLKQFLAIRFNDFLSNPVIPLNVVIFLSVFSGIFWSAIISGDRKRVIQIFAIAFAANALLLEILSITKWFASPSLGPVVILILGVGVAFGITQLSTGISNRQSLYAALSMAVIGTIAYFPAQWAFTSSHPRLAVLVMAGITIGFAIVSAQVFARVDKGPVTRTAILTSVIIAVLIIIDRLMREWAPYMANDAVNFRPVPTFGQTREWFTPVPFWMRVLDTLIHLILPTIALTLISFAGYIRYARGTLLEVLNQDYIRTARAKGLTERTVIMRHAFRNTMIPLTTIMVADIVGIIGGAIITERVFGWTGMGTLFNKAINSFDLNLLMGVFFLTASLAVIANLIQDLLYSALDPRVRVGAGK